MTMSAREIDDQRAARWYDPNKFLSDYPAGIPLYFSHAAHLRCAAWQSDLSYWWDGESMRFFNTRVLAGGQVWNTPAGALFVTSEQRDDEPRRYTVRLHTVWTTKEELPKHTDAIGGEHFSGYTANLFYRTNSVAADADGVDLGGFQRYPTRARALGAARALARRLNERPHEVAALLSKIMY